jgi:hypothetical protein
MNSVRENMLKADGDGADEAAESKTPLFSVSDDNLFLGREQIRLMAETPPRDQYVRDRQLTLTTLAIFGCLLSAAVAAWNNMRALGTEAVIALLVICSLPLARSQTEHERANITGEGGLFSLGKGLPDACIDSGCTTTAIPLRLRHLIQGRTSADDASHARSC